MSFDDGTFSLVKLAFLLIKQTYNINSHFLCFKFRKFEHIHVTNLY